MFCFCLVLEPNVNYKLTFYFSVSLRVFIAVMAKGQKVPGPKPLVNTGGADRPPPTPAPGHDWMLEQGRYIGCGTSRFLSIPRLE